MIECGEFLAKGTSMSTVTLWISVLPEGSQFLISQMNKPMLSHTND